MLPDAVDTTAASSTPPGDGSTTPYRQIKALFDAVADLPDEATQRARLAELGADVESAERVMRMLGLADERTHFSQPVAQALAEVAGSELSPGDTLGPWRLVKPLGAGGMGQVFLAERNDGHYEQRAAIKLLRGWTGAEALARLARERQILAKLSHPNIARLLDGGTTPLGRPYLVLEYVEGQAIDRHCEQLQLAAPARLGLLRMVCDAVAAAHRQLVVHCDIKPSNVLVGHDGRAMLLDFGIAQLQEQAGDPSPRALALTPRYASPEQRAGAMPGPASDIYSLGCMIDELLSAPQARTPRPAEWRAIVRQACAEEPAARYATVQELADDLRRYEQHLPLRALPRTPGYVLSKLMRRRWPWALAATGALTMAAGFTLQLVQQRDRAVRAEQQAREQVRTTQAVNDFVVGLFRGADPRITGNTEVTAKSVVDQGRTQIATSLRDQPDQQAQLLAVLGEVYGNMGHEEPAIEVLRQAIDLEGPQKLNRPLRESWLQERLAQQLGANGNPDEAQPHARRALALLEGRSDVDVLTLADAHATVGVQLGKLIRTDEARPHLQRALELVQKLYGPVHPRVAGAHMELTDLERFAQRPAQAEWHGRQALAIAEQLPDRGGAEGIFWRNVLVGALMDQGKTAEAIALQRTVVADAVQRFGPSASFTSEAHRRLAAVLRKDGQWAASVASIRNAMAAAEQGGITQTLIHGNTEQMLGRTLAQVGDSQEAERHLRRGLALRQQHLAADSLPISRSLTSLGSLMLWRGDAALAQRELMRAMPAVQGMNADKTDRAETELHLAQAEARTGQGAAARERLARLEPALKRWALPQPALFLQARAWVARGERQPLKAAALFAEAADLLKPQGPDDALRQMLLMDRAEALAAANRPDEARRQLEALAPGVAPYPPTAVVQQRLRTLRSTAWASGGTAASRGT